MKPTLHIIRLNNRSLDKRSLGLYKQGIDEIGLLRNITNVISNEYNVNIRSINIDSNAGTFQGTVMLYIHDTQHLNELINKLKKLKGVETVSRIGKD